MSSHFQEERLQLIKELLSLIDKDNTGFINTNDSEKILKTLGRQFTTEELGEFIGIIDPKNEGKVSVDAFMEGIKTVYTMPKEFITEVKDAFKLFDTNKDGKIGVNELKRILVKYGENDMDKINGIFKKLDIQENGEIEINDFIETWAFQ